MSWFVQQFGSAHLVSPCWQVGSARLCTRAFVCVSVCVCAYCQIQLICQCSGLFLERPELASLNQAAINLPQQRKGAAGADAAERSLMGKRAVMLLEQVTVRSDGPFPDLHFSGDSRKIMQWGDVYLFGYIFDVTFRIC